MYHVNNEEKKSYVITYKELIFTFLVFSVLLFVLYPKDLLKEQILSEKSNYDLSMLYLKNLLKHSPEDESLMLILAEQSLRTGKKDLSLRLLQLLLKSKDIKHRQRATLLSYDLEKDNYFYMRNKDKNKKKIQMKKLRDLFDAIYINRMYDQKDLDKWYKESIFVQNDIATYDFVKQKLLKDKTNVEYLEQAYYLSQKLDLPKDSRKYIQLLTKYDSARQDKWALDEYYMYVHYKEYDLAQDVLLKYYKTSVEWKKRLADFYLMRHKFKSASKLYMELMSESDRYNTKKKYFYKSVNSLLAGKYMDDAVKLVKRYEKYFIKDLDARTFMLKVYISANRLDYASGLSKKILNKELKL